MVKALVAAWALVATAAGALVATWPSSPAPAVEAELVVQHVPTMPAPTPTTLAPPSSSSCTSDVSAGFVDRINAERAAAGLNALAGSDDLCEYARRHLAAMLADPSPINSGLWHSDIGQHLGGKVGWDDLGENLGRGTRPGEVHRWLMASPTHRANVLDPDFQYVAAATVEDGPAYVTVHVFGGVRP